MQERAILSLRTKPDTQKKPHKLTLFVHGKDGKKKVNQKFIDLRHNHFQLYFSWNGVPDMVVFSCLLLG